MQRKVVVRFSVSVIASHEVFRGSVFVGCFENIENSCREKVPVGLSKLVTNELSSFAVGTLAGLVLAF